MTEWSEDHVAAIGPFKLKPWNLCLMSDKTETTQGQLGRPAEHSEWKDGDSDVSILRFLCGSPRLYRLRTEGLVPMSKYRMYRSHAGDMALVSWCSCVTTWPKPLSPTPRLSWGRGNEVTQDNDRASLSLVGKTSPRCRACFILVGTSERLPTWTTWDVGFGTLCKSSVESVSRVDRVFLYRVSIYSNRHDSRIWVTACSWLPSSSNLLD
jgi:hypothetical protein